MSVGIFHDYDARVLGLQGQVEESDFNVLADQLLRLDTESDDLITLYVSSAGGNLVDVLKVIDVFEALRSPVRGIGLGLIQNAGAAILPATAKPAMLPSAILFPAKLWDLPSPKCTIGLQVPESISIQTLLNRRLDDLAIRKSVVVSFIREAEKSPRFKTAHEAKQQGLIHKIIEAPSTSPKQVKHHVR